ncbi:metal-dependent hydrolase [Luteimonas sp. SX5]|uniref:Metal-dependent hydrolase n=1 Tax=Luteimonas galliterrae TaxID=2940486 RepID=A0ABT0MKD9_9GAMM|nr:metal-dependent hydrolase [Luteimonas galliterrae]MCL1635357.1 metal-dependent hydrolase [Luteimonas galliterrae]
MDSITHLFYGGAIAAAIAPAKHRRAALLAGAALNTLPDLDVFPLRFCDPVTEMTWHRGMTHSWFVLPFVAWAVWAFFRRRGGRVAQEPQRWFWAIFVCLTAHPLIDSFTVYGTQLFWPLPMKPLMWSSLFIIDPLFTLPWFVACVVAWFALQRPLADKALCAGIALGVAYVGWSLTAKALVERQARPALAAMGLSQAPRFSVPMPFNTLLWRVAAMTPDGYVEGYRSLAADRGPMVFKAHTSDVQALREAEGIEAVDRLAWFNHGFMQAREEGGRLVLADLRMGAEPDYFFRFAVAERDADEWRAIVPEQIMLQRDVGAAWSATWQRIRHTGEGNLPTGEGARSSSR